MRKQCVTNYGKILTVAMNVQNFGVAAPLGDLIVERSAIGGFESPEFTIA
jgi:hypothetical protein